MQLVVAPDATPPLPAFSQATISGDRVYVSGNIGCTPDWVVVEGGVQAQTRAILENIRKVLQAAGSDLELIVKANVFLINMQRDFGPMNEVYIQFFDRSKMPARTCVGVTSLPLPDALVEIECIAELRK